VLTLATAVEIMVLSSDSRAEWTVSRCFRLLRPIVSRKSASTLARPGETRRKDVRSRIAPAVIRAKFGDSPNSKLDPDWMSKPRKLAPRQYVRLGPTSSSDPVLELSAGSLSIPTPIIARIRGAEARSPASISGHRFECSSSGKGQYSQSAARILDSQT
jgi:hypothetical protein